MMTTTQMILDELASTTKRSEKEAILVRERNNLELRKVFGAAYSPDITYWIAKHPFLDGFAGTRDISEAIDLVINRIASRELTGNAAIDLYQAILESLTPDDAEVLHRVIDRDLRCGVGVATINKIWKGLIPTYKLMKAESDPKKLVFPCYVQAKYDGLRCVIKRGDDRSLVMLTSSGNQITSLSVMHEGLCSVIAPNETWDGELVCYRNGEPLSRKESNGIMNKALRNTISPDEAEMVRFIAWDLVDTSSTIPYDQRFKHITDAIQDNKKVLLSENHIAKDLEEVGQLFNHALEMGQEGVIAKNIRSVWQPKRTFDMVKFKAEKTCDLLVVDWEEGTGRNKGRLGALVCETSDGKIRVSVGTGFSDQQRTVLVPDMILDTVVEVLYNERITKKAGGLDSLFLPRFLKIRRDKVEPNSSAEVV